MSIAFIGVHRLINKMVDTCAKFTDTSGSYSSYSNFSNYSNQSNFLKPQTQPSPWVSAPINIGTAPGVSTKFPPPTTAIPLKVMRLMEKQSSPLNAGRMVISGRFADVCAELDRLAERQNQQISLRK